MKPPVLFKFSPSLLVSHHEATRDTSQNFAFLAFTFNINTGFLIALIFSCRILVKRRRVFHEMNIDTITFTTQIIYRKAK